MSESKKPGNATNNKPSSIAVLAVAIGLISALLLVPSTQLVSFLPKGFFPSSTVSSRYAPGAESGVCPQVPPLTPSNRQIHNFINTEISTPEHQSRIISTLSGIIQIPSESHDDLGPIGTDPRWAIFSDIEAYIKRKYPRIFQTLSLDHANTHGLILTWPGSVSPSLAKPILMLAHQDVVPVLADNVPDWTHPPYSGHFDGQRIWGRGATDDKGYLISLLESIDLLIRAGFKPKRTIILAFGCDEEISGENCGRPIAEFLHDTYGDDGVYMIMDEGSVGVQRAFETSFAMVSVAEKGYLDVGINVTATGGHASNPPDHSVIGIMAEIVAEIENSPFEGKVTAGNPMFGFLECAAVHAPESVFPDAVRGKLDGVARGDTKAERQLGKLLDDMRYYFRTSQSVGKINGGVKINAIPELVTTMINLRLAVETSIAGIQSHYEKLIEPIARKHNMTFEGFNSSHDSPERRKISLFGIDALEPAPVSPVDAESYKILSGTIQSTLHPLYGTDKLVVTPYLMPANTDTKFFWKLTRNIYRFTPISMVGNMNGAHTTDEFIDAAEFVREPAFFAGLVLGADDAVKT